MHRPNNASPDEQGALHRYAPEITMQLQKLLLALGHQGSQHLTEVDADLRQTSYLLDEAITKLGRNFFAIHAAITAQHALITTLKEGEQVSPAVRTRLDELQQEATGCVNAAVTALQFQDMTNQLVGRAVSHVASLHEVLSDAGNAGALLTDVPAQDGSAQTLAVLILVNRMLEQRATNLDKVPGKAVAQTHLESGDIELF